MTDPRTPRWTLFLRALAEEVDTLGGEGARDALLRDAGRRMAAMQPLPAAARMDVLELDANAVLAEWGWGSVTLRIAEQDRSLLLDHSGLPGIGGAGDPPGTWLSAVLEGLYEGWLGQLPGADRTLVARRYRAAPGSVLLRYGRV